MRILHWLISLPPSTRSSSPSPLGAETASRRSTEVMGIAGGGGRPSSHRRGAGCADLGHTLPQFWHSPHRPTHCRLVHHTRCRNDARSLVQPFRHVRDLMSIPDLTPEPTDTLLEKVKESVGNRQCSLLLVSCKDADSGRKFRQDRQRRAPAHPTDTSPDSQWSQLPDRFCLGLAVASSRSRMRPIPGRRPQGQARRHSPSTPKDLVNQSRRRLRSRRAPRDPRGSTDEAEAANAPGVNPQSDRLAFGVPMGSSGSSKSTRLPAQPTGP